jgi:hypothetical protein
MIRAISFRVSDKPFAVDLSSYRLDSGHGAGEVDAAWFRRRKGILVACAGMLRNYQLSVPETAEGFLAAYTNSAYGGDCKARWDGTNLWSLADEAERERYKRLLVPMLAAYPEVPEGYSGWYVFERH